MDAETRSNPTGKRALLAAIAPCAVILCLEGLLAVCGFRPPRHPNYGSSPDYWIPDPNPDSDGFVRAFPRNYKLFPERGPLFAASKPENGLRIFVLGESSVKGLPYETGSFSDWLRLRATAMLPDMVVEVVNAGNSGWHASDVRTLLDECLEHDPDFLIWMVGHNEFVPDNLLTLRFEVERPFLAATKRLADRLRTTWWIRSYLTGRDPGSKSIFDQLQSSERPCYGPESALVRTRFLEATRGAVRDARAAGVPIVLCTMPRNLTDSEPSYSFHADSVLAVPALRERWDARFAAGKAALEQGAPAIALAEFEAALEIDSDPAKLHYAMGRTFEAAGRVLDARASYAAALARDACPMRAQDWVERAIRDVAAAESVPLADLESAFDERGRIGLADDSLIFDNVHPNLLGHELIASILIDLLAREFSIPFDRQRDVDPETGRRRLGIDTLVAASAQREECLHLVRIALSTGLVDEAWHKAEAACRAFLERDPMAWDVVGARGLLAAIGGDAERAAAWIRAAMNRDASIRINYLVHARTEPRYRKAFEAAGLDLVAIESALSPAERTQLSNRLYRAGIR